MPPQPVTFGERLTAGTACNLLQDLAEDCVRRQVRHVPSALDLACDWSARLPRVGGGDTLLLWEALASVAAYDLQAARVLEPHLDAQAILAEAGSKAPPAWTTWGVYAAEVPRQRVDARRGRDGTWLLSGVKPWCSLAGEVTDALMTAWVDGQQRRLFALRLGDRGVRLMDEPWVARGLPGVRSTGLELTDVPAEPVGSAQWYLERDGFAWGGMGVAAVWFGGAVAVARRMQLQAEEREPDQIAQMHLGAVDAALSGAQAMLVAGATAIDGGTAAGPAGRAWALRVRHVVADAAEEVLRRAAHALGPGPLVGEDEHAARVADLGLYLRQHHAERDTAQLGSPRMPGRPW